MARKIVLLSSSFPPDYGAGSIRSYHLATSLHNNSKTKLTVITSSPKRYLSENHSKFDLGSIDVRRCPAVSVRGQKMREILSFIRFASFVITSIITSKDRPDLVVATSSKFGTALLAFMVSKFIGSKVFFDIRDIFSHSLRGVSSSIPTRVLTALLEQIEIFTFSRADGLNFVSPGFQKLFDNKKLNRKISLIPNGVDEIFLNDFQVDHCENENNDTRYRRILYAGNFGQAQDLSSFLRTLEPAAELLACYEFCFIGAGVQEIELKNISTLGTLNINLAELRPREQLIYDYHNADALLLTLKRSPVFETVIPSKIFEYLATGRPILAGVKGFTADFVSQFDGVFVFDVDCKDSFINSLKKATAGKRYDRRKQLSEYTRTRTINRLVAEINKVSNRA